MKKTMILSSLITALLGGNASMIAVEKSTKQEPTGNFTEEYLKKGVLPAMPHEMGNVNAQKLVLQTGLLSWLTHQLSFTSKTLKGHESYVRTAVFDSTGTRVVTSSWDNTAKIWNARTGELIIKLNGHKDIVNSAVFDRAGTHVVTSSWDNTAKIWNARTGELIITLKGHKRQVSSAAFDSTGTRVVTSSDDGTVNIWNAQTGVLLFTLKGEGALASVAFDSTGTRVVTSSKIWNAQTGELLCQLEGHRVGVHSAAFDSTGTRIVTSDYDQAMLWNAQTGELLFTLKGHTGKLVSAAFDSTGTRVVTSSYDWTAKIWNAQTGELIFTFEGLSDTEAGRYRGFRDDTAVVFFTLRKGSRDTVRLPVFDSTGTRVVTIATAPTTDNTAKIWNAQTGELLLTLKGHTFNLYKAVFDSTGTRVLTSSEDNTTKIWDISILNYLEHRLSLVQILLLNYIYETEMTNRLQKGRSEKLLFDLNSYPHLKNVYESFPKMLRAVLKKYVKMT